LGPCGWAGGQGLQVGRFEELRAAAPDLVNTVPAISVFLKPRSQGPRYVKETNERVVVTWELSEPRGGMRTLQDFSFFPTTNRVQAALYPDGTIDMSWYQTQAEDAIVGVFSVPPGGASPTEPVSPEPADPDAPPAASAPGELMPQLPPLARPLPPPG